jgi:hypothetical protein
MFKLYEVDTDADTLLIVPAAADSGDSKSQEASQLQLRIKVSSKHLSLASPRFSYELKGASIDEADSRYHLQLSGFDPEAVKIIANIIHGRGSRVPKSVDVDVLANIAFFVESYQCLDAVEVYVERWVRGLEGGLPKTYGREVVLWMYISYVFHLTDLFKAFTKIVIAESNGPIHGLGFPLRERLIGKLLKIF